MRKDLYLAGGCFWGLEHYFNEVPGVLKTEVGYANSDVPSPTYNLVCSGRTGAAETVHVVYDDDVLPLNDLLRLYFDVIDPFSYNRQGNDFGTQYRTGIYTEHPAELPDLLQFAADEQDRLGRQLAVEVMPLLNFYRAENYHQKYLQQNPGGYCHIGKEAFDHARNYKVETS